MPDCGCEPPCDCKPTCDHEADWDGAKTVGSQHNLLDIRCLKCGCGGQILLQVTNNDWNG